MNEPCAEQWLTKHLIGEGYFITVANPDLQMGGGGGGHPDSEIRGGPGPLPWIHHCIILLQAPRQAAH